MTSPIRRGGRGRLRDGTLLTWSVADGTRGRRWRASTVHDGQLASSLLLEVDTEGRVARLELASAEGLLTLHPGDGNAELHGNVVTPDGIRHLAFAWSPAHELLVADLPVTAMIALARLDPRTEPGNAIDCPVVVVGEHLEVTQGRCRFERLDAGSWRVTGVSIDEIVRVDPDGLPADLEDAEDWPLER